MASNAELLKKAKKKFTPTKYRAWENIYEKPLEKPDVENSLKNNHSKTQIAEDTKRNSFNNVKEHSKFNKDTQVITKHDTKQATKPDQKQDTDLDTKPDTETTNVLEKDKIEALKLLFGNSKKIISFFIAECIKNKSNSTALLNNSYISQSTGIKIGSIRNTINRLIKKGILQKSSLKKGGAGAPSRYSIPINIYNHIGSDLNKDFTYGIAHNNEYQDLNKTELSNLWSQIKFDDLKDYGFSDNHINQIAKLGVISPDDLQESIDYFVFDLLKNNKASEIKKSPVEFFMGIMRGQGFYTAPKNFESLKDRALRLKTEQAKQQQEKRLKMESELIGIEFNKWHSNLTDIEIDKLIPARIKNTNVAKEAQIISFLRGYFKDKCWSTIQQEKYSDCFELEQA
jgi:hypothetical protein